MTLVSFRFGRLFPVIAAITLGAFSGCVSTTTIQSRPQGARIFLDGAPVGNTPYALSDTKMVGSTTQIRLEYPGYQTFNGVIVRNEELDVLALIGGILLLVPLLWVMGYQPNHVFDLQPLAPGGYPGAAAPYGNPPGAPEAYPPAPASGQGYPPAPAQGYPPPPAQGYPPPPAQGYPPAPAQGYPPAPAQGYPPPPPAYPPAPR
jgi:PEGA domain